MRDYYVSLACQVDFGRQYQGNALIEPKQGLGVPDGLSANLYLGITSRLPVI